MVRLAQDGKLTQSSFGVNRAQEYTFHLLDSHLDPRIVINGFENCPE
jgi:predicted oxidoreductase